jgi:hypothetical protein
LIENHFSRAASLERLSVAALVIVDRVGIRHEDRRFAEGG